MDFLSNSSYFQPVSSWVSLLDPVLRRPVMKSPPMGCHLLQGVKTPSHWIPVTKPNRPFAAWLSLREGTMHTQWTLSISLVGMNVYHFQVLITANLTVSVYLLLRKADSSNSVWICICVHVCMHLYSEDDTAEKTLACWLHVLMIRICLDGNLGLKWQTKMWE